MRKLYYFLPPVFRRIARRLYYLPVDIYEKISGKRPALCPPKGKVFIGSGDFIEQGERLMGQLKEFGELKPKSRLLDIGSGIGRLAVPLTGFLNEQGSYEGFDIVKAGVKWCDKHINAAYPNFRFTHIDLKNDLYNLKSKSGEAKAFVFPYGDDEFDLAFLFSVFSHMMPEDVDNYLQQIYRVLKPGGKCVATFFVLDEVSEKAMKEKTDFNFKFDKGEYFLMDENVKEANIAFRGEYLFEMISKAGFAEIEFVAGPWSGREAGYDGFQDLVVLRK